ncbi:MAG: hypothetical protein A07HR60_02508 [uncultured archaeon A07HR60]|nr:MAG: hypothetical protein A07HR60_02508 [uncultured archaeon A07HR60]
MYALPPTAEAVGFRAVPTVIRGRTTGKWFGGENGECWEPAPGDNPSEPLG